ncbi:carboxymuconolactone decarboxylase family protein [Undibacterium sp. TS12]|uniref:carboxymuconolactone decarboxylase family protein n=1 Tax=Undibacterium sp. TS12 TaxID=2908202 RepID=UPI001F4D22DC|nr:carboxymuconolactone decarboxylase family protein [Undibacterium sp. TS12]MCH8618644.1 carboxymuconolactone decarboxylase family protein [Undibacterium sp. TS12]
MSHVQLINPQEASNDRQTILNEIHAAFGATPNMFRAVANSTAALKSMWSAFGALGGGCIPAKLGEQIAVAIANQNQCEYCLAAHTVLGQKAGASAEEMAAAKDGSSADLKTDAALKFVLKVVTRRAQVSKDDIDSLRQAGYGDEHIVEILAHVALNLYTNYINVALDVPVDFPKVRLSTAAR